MEEKILGDYKVVKKIGSGALGDVYLAEHRFIKKTFVLKILPASLTADRTFIERFEEKVGSLANLEHPNIVKIHNVSFAEGVYFLVTDCVVDSLGETTNLAEYMSGRKERLREEELLVLLKQIASALDYAHFHKTPVVHENLKLSNILIGKANPGIFAAISDFGLAPIVGRGALLCRAFKSMADSLALLPSESKIDKEAFFPLPIEADANISKLSRSFMQSFAFMAPEQKRGGPIVGTRPTTDTYAFGVLAFYLIYGAYPEGFFVKVKEFAPEYQYAWDDLLQRCLQHAYEDRPDRLLPELEKICKAQALESVQDELPKPRVRVTEEEKREVSVVKAPQIEVLSAEVLRQRLANKIGKVEAKIPVETALVVERAEAKSVGSATPLAINPPKDEVYSQKLSAMLNREPVVTEYHIEQERSRVIEPLLTEMSVIPSGRFLRGCNAGNRDEMPQHQIELPGFAIDVHPVTNEQFVRFLEFMGGEKDANYHDIIRLRDSRISRSAGHVTIESGYAKHPVVGVTWYGAIAYAKWVGQRLPSEAEWEVAAKGGREDVYPTGEKVEKNQANFFSSDTTSVKSYQPNGYGLYDMAGNVYEWCQDWYGYNYYETSELEPLNPKGPIQGVYRVLRGGCWKSLAEDLRCSHRHRNNPGTVTGTYGFRCAADV